MTLIAWIAAGLGVWLLDSAVRGRNPIETMKNIVQGGNVSDNLASRGLAHNWNVNSGAVSVAAEGTESPQGLRSPGTAFVTGNGTVDQWVNEAENIMSRAGVNMARIHANDIKTIIQHESGGDPNAINNWDSNAKAGHPSQGLMQTIPGTFREYALPGHNNILNPVDNIIAGTRYAISRYGYTWQVPGVKALANGKPYVGY